MISNFAFFLVENGPSIKKPEKASEKKGEQTVL
jgi:hypothetical protein